MAYLDPPWDYGGQSQHGGKGKPTTGSASVHYPTVKLHRLKRFPMREILAEDALVFMWTTNPHLDQAIDLLRAWGLKFATVAFCWDKERLNPGFYTMSQVELCLVAKTGKIPQPRGIRNARQYVKQRRMEHSRKPDEVMKRIEAMFPTQRKVELFARRKAPGWHCWGNQVEAEPELQAFLAAHGWE